MGLGLDRASDSVDLLKIATMLQFQAQREEGLVRLAAALEKTPARKLLCEPQGGIIPGGSQNLQNIFKGLRASL